MTARRLFLSLAMLLAGTALLVAAAGSASSTAQVRKGGTLRLGTFQDVYYVDPALAYTAWSAPVTFATCAKLFNHPDEPGAGGTRVIPEVVERYTVSKDGRTYTFTLKRTFRFHNGAPVTAQSFADAFNRNANPELKAADATSFMHEIEGADAVIDGHAESITGVRALSRDRLQVRLTKPVGDFTARLTMPFFCPILPGTPIDPKGIDNPAGSGPYYVAERVVNQQMVLERNPFYRGSRPANVDRIAIAIGERPEACLASVEADRTDLCGGSNFPVGAYRALAEKYGINKPSGRLFVGPSRSTYFFGFNHQRPAFAGAGQIPLKKAINYAVDRREMASVFGYLGGKRTDQLLPPAMARAESIYPLGGPNFAAARRWYARARIRPTTLVLYTWTFPPAVAIAGVLAYNLQQIGIDVQVKYFDVATVVEKYQTPGEPYDIVLHGWLPDYLDGAAFFLPALGPGGYANGVHIDDPRVLRRLAAANRLTGDARRRAWADLDVDLMRNNPPWIPVIHGTYRKLVSRSTDCFYTHPAYGVDLAAICKKR